MFAYAHPAMLRMLGFGVASKFRQYPMHGKVAEPKHDLPEGTIYLPGIDSDHDVPDADQFLRKYLGELGLLAE
jgi:hypothetical protein